MKVLNVVIIEAGKERLRQRRRLVRKLGASNMRIES